MNNFRYAFAVLVVIAVHCSAVPIAENDCSKVDGSIKLSMRTHRNETGNWITHVHVERGESAHPERDRDLIGEVKQTAARCNCSTEIVHIEAKIVAPPPKPGTDYTLLSGLGYYKLYNLPRTWSEARHICRNDNAHLVILNSNEEAQAVKQMFRGLTNASAMSSHDHVFAGFHDELHEGHFMTVLGQELGTTGYLQWSDPNEPNNKGSDADCGSVHSNGGLSDVPCHWKLAFICEQELWD